VWGSNGLGELWRRAKSIIEASGFTADPLFAVHFMYTIALLPLASRVITQLSDWQLACLIFCG
jgi:hypothetical protein